MNRRGAVLHWVLFGVMAALGLFLLQTGLFTGLGGESDGVWAYNFLEQVYYPAEEQQLAEQAAIHLQLQKAVSELTLKGGTTEKLNCGDLGSETIFWNKGEEWCYPDFVNGVEETFSLKLKQERVPYSSLERKDYTFIVENGVGSVEKEKMKYSYPASFQLDFSGAVKELQQVIGEAQRLVQVCSQEKKVQGCIAREQKENWKSGACGQEKAIPAAERKSAFCVIGKEARYQFALDFTAQVMAVEEVTVAREDDTLRILFPKVESADSYTVYVTDDERLYQQEGPARELFAEVLPEKFGDAFTVENWVEGGEACSSGSSAAAGAYTCGGDILFVLDHSGLEGTEPYYVTVTASNEGKESRVKAWDSS